MSTPQTQAVEKTQAKKSVRDLLEGDAFKQAVQKALPKHVTADRFVRVALTATLRQPKLLECDRESLFSQLMTLSQFGLEPDGRLSHLIPFWNSKRNTYEVQLIIDYKGLVALAMRSGNVSFIHADVVCENDVCEYSRGQILAHKIDFKNPRGEMYAAYALVQFKDKTEKCEVMGKEAIDSVRARSKAKDSGPWVSDYQEMAKKTVFRRLSKWIELSPEFRDATDKDDDALEDRRFELAKPAIVNREESFLPPAPSEPTETTQASEPEATAETPEPQTVEAMKKPAAQLTEWLADNSITQAQFFTWFTASGIWADADSVSTIDEIPSTVINKLLKSKTGMLAGLKGMATVAK